MQPPTHTTPPPPRGDEGELYRRHHRDLERAVARSVRAPRELIEDACQMAWMTLLRTQPERLATFAWLRRVAINEVYRLSHIERRDARLDATSDRCQASADPNALEKQLLAREALHALSTLPERQRRDLTLHVAGHSYTEIAELTGGRTYTNVAKTLRKAKARIRLLQMQSELESPTSAEGERQGANNPGRPS
ncbi:sigma-70 family RNA polymerase sigma factor [Paraconexibacter antarcticus]|uniref:Sigma-70 family RNA polymerase sigma factor n=1 Tax=Paraconexibacter antarcticus TaxID=2949664 RepID=A0ABY5DT81_9ACTN|nr:sigma-70 family RNA polymerase sigma factor [Paraconexibacter antarcticus]UTI64886.1 sigma-70 family RNA polymerase sigma factor [Paraconexibacter antarcticus]